MDHDKTGPSRRHHISSSSGTSSSATPMYSESYFNVDENFSPSSSSSTMFNSPSLRPQQSSNQFQNFQPPPQNNFHQSSSFFTPNDNYSNVSSPWQTSMDSGTGVFGPGMQPTTNNQMPPSAGGPSPTMMFANQQFLMAAGQQLLSNPMTAAAIDAYSQSLVDKSKGWMGNIKQYFAVDTNYAIKKLLLIFLPFLHKDWSIRYNQESVAPRDEPNLPDLYIPSMAFITYILVSGYILGLRNQFEPDQLGIYASSALAWLLLEVFLIMIAKYLLNLSSALGFLHMISFGGYKFVCIDALLVASVMFGRNSYVLLFIYSSLSLGYFLLRALSTNLQQGQQSTYQQYDQNNPRTAYYLVIFIALLQPVVMYFLTASLATTVVVNSAISSGNQHITSDHSTTD